ncbi:MAG TPA: site-specific integrase, partial [bacterium]|nr:site-specific integrase [bacterium]
DDIDFHKGFISLRDPKGKEPQKIPLNDSAKSVFESIPKHKSGFVFTMNNGKPFTTDLRRRLNRIRDAAEIPQDFRALHGLRHVYASMLASSGQVDMYTLQKLLTHKSPLMTQRYAHLRDETLRKASTLAGSIIEKAVKANNEKNKVKTA